MKQQVNLYQIRFRREAMPLAARRLAQGLGGVLLLLLLLTGHAYWRSWRAEQRLDTARAHRASESTRIVELASLYPPAAVDPALEAEVARLGAERDAKTQLLQLLANQSLGNTQGFSEQVTALARRRIDGLWLRTLQIRRGGEELTLAGSALQPELVPRLLQELGREKAFEDTAFHSLLMERPEQEPGRVDFRLTTHEEPAS